MGDISTITLRSFLESPLDVPLLQWILCLMVLALIVTFVYLQLKDDSIDLRWLIMERPNKPSLSKIGQIVALLVSTWGFVVLVLKGQMTETYMLVYMGTWTGSTMIHSYLSKKYGPSRRYPEHDKGEDDVRN